MPSARSATRRRWVSIALILAMTLLLASCAKVPQTALDPQGPQAEKVNRLFNYVWPVAAVFFVLVEGMIIVAIIRFRNRAGSPEPTQIHGNTVLEIGWTVAPALILAVIAIPTMGTLFNINKEPKDPLRIAVIGHQWWWEYRYPGDSVVTANELHIPINRPVRLTLDSDEPIQGPGAKGVIHSYWVPALAGKVDVMPGRKNKMTIQADHPGEYLGQCAEFCGTSHANMRLRVYAETPEDFESWMREQAAPASKPIALFNTKGCVGCHTVNTGDATGNNGARVGPNLTHFASRNTFAGAIFERTPEELRKWLANPPGRKPGSIMPNLHLKPDEIEQLVAYLESLK